ncbi:hypothetical protein BDZ89DRAFT_370368 [Hymenopellis radicata]|nr:hypothetical protein BDZ89DRAFT_370368 [Hymenopellis radicata]
MDVAARNISLFLMVCGSCGQLLFYTSIVRFRRNRFDGLLGFKRFVPIVPPWKAGCGPKYHPSLVIFGDQYCLLLHLIFVQTLFDPTGDWMPTQGGAA